MDESRVGADFSRYLMDRMRQLEERNLALREQKDRVEGEKRVMENQKLKFAYYTASDIGSTKPDNRRWHIGCPDPSDAADQVGADTFLRPFAAQR